MGETTWLLQPNTDKGMLDIIHQTAFLLEESDIQDLRDVIPAYESLTIIFNDSDIDLKKTLSGIDQINTAPKLLPEFHEINVCYELGLDWKEIEINTRLTKEEVILIHSSIEYTIAMMGFLPGFIFLEGLDDRIAVSRKENPRIKIPSGSVGIGGNQTGIYSLESPGGWQIIGRTADSFFDVEKKPPTKLKAGDKIRFNPISKEEFDKMVAKNG